MRRSRLARTGHRLSGDRRDEPLRVLVLRPLEHVGRSSGLDDLALEHDEDAVAEQADDAEVVADEQDRDASRVAKLEQELEHVGLHRDVEARRRLVGDEEARVGEKRARDAHALRLAPAQLVGVPGEDLRRELHALHETPRR